MSIQPPNGILDITGATLRVSKMEFSNVTGFDTVLNNVARNTVLHVDTTEYTANVAYAVKPPNMFMAQFDLELAAGGTGLPCNFNYYNDSNLGTSFNGYNLSFNDTSIILTYDGGSALHTATLSSSLNNGVYRKVKVLFDRDTTLVSINGENVFRFKDTLRPRTYDTGTTGYIRWWHNSPVARKIKNLKVSNGEKWAQEYDSAGLSSNISYTHGLVGVGTSVPEYTLDVAGDIRASGNLIVNGSNTLINTTSLAIEDGVIECGKGNSSAAKDLGFLMVRNDGSSTTNSNVAMFWDESTDALTFGFSDSGPTATTLTPNTTKTLNSYFVGNVGIGTASPGEKLHIYTNDTSNTQLTLRNDESTARTGICIRNAAGQDFNIQHIGGSSAGSNVAIIENFSTVNGGIDFYSKGDGKYTFHTTNSNDVRLRILNNGNVGIGTASPTKKLHVYTSASEGNTQLLLQSANQYSSLHMKDSGGGIIAQNDQGTFRLITGYDASDSGGTEKFRVTGSGNVGVGTNNPSYKLDVNGDIRHDTHLRSTSSTQRFWTSGSSTNWIQFTTSGTSTDHILDLQANNGNCVVSSRGSTPLLLNPSTGGNVGIGTASPTGNLQITSDLANASDQINPVAQLVLHSSLAGLDDDGDIGASLVFTQRWLDSSPDSQGTMGSIHGFKDLSAGNYGGGLLFKTQPGSDTSPVERMRIDKDGNVGIGEASPAENLHIRGSGPHILIEGASNENGQIDFSSGPSYRTSRHRIEANHYALSGNGYRNRLVFKVNEGGESTPGSRMVIRGDGRVGIGTFDPTETLHVHENLSTSGHQIAARIGGTASSTYSTLVFGTKEGRPHIGGHKGDYGAWHDLSLQNDIMVLKQSNMCVGIGTVSPGAKLQVKDGSGDNVTDFRVYSGGTIRVERNHNNAPWFQTTMGSGFPGIYLGNSDNWRIRKWYANLDFDYGGSTKGYLLSGSNVGQIDFTGQHRSFIDGVLHTEYDSLEGLIVSANKNKYFDIDENLTTGANAIQISQSLPLVSISTKEKDKACFGVISGSEDPDSREYAQGSFVTVVEKQVGDRRAFINSVGEGAIWVTNANGPLESGDYITTSNVAGYGMLQDDDILHNYTVAKITMDCDFSPATQPVQIIKKELGNVNYWVETTYTDVALEEYSNLTEENRQTVTTTMFSNEEGIITPTEYSNLESNVQATYSEIETVTYQKITRMESKTEQEGWTLEVRQELTNVLDEHGQLQWEDHPTETEKAYKIRYLDADGKITTEANKVYTAAFVGCTYHCG